MGVASGVEVNNMYPADTKPMGFAPWLFFNLLVVFFSSLDSFIVRLILQMSISHNEVEILFVDIVIATMLRCPVRKAVEEMLLPGRGLQRDDGARGSQQDDGARGSQQDDGARGSQKEDGARRWCRRGRNKMILMLKDQDLDLDTMS